MATIIVTKPAEAGAALADALRAAGATVLFLPAFEIEGAADPVAARGVLAQLSGLDLALFVSPAAVRATRVLLPGNMIWPTATRIAAVGAGTALAARTALPLSPTATVLAPDTEAAEEAPGSEALWDVLRTLQPPPRRVLILRAEQGREWLGERLRENGAEVHTLAVYRRTTRAWTHYADAADIAAALRAGATIVVTSSEAAAVVRDNVVALRAVGAEDWPEPTLIATHPRVAATLRDAGFATVHTLPTLDAQAVLQAGR